MKRSARTVPFVVSIMVAIAMIAIGSPLASPQATVTAQEQASPDRLVITAVEMPPIAAPGWFNATAVLENPTDSNLTEAVTFRFEGGPHDIVIHRRVTVPPNASRRVPFALNTSGFDPDRYIAGVTTVNSSELEDIELATTADIDLDPQQSNGTAVTIDSAFLPRGGYVVIHDSNLSEGRTVGSVIGTSTYLSAGFHQDVTVRLYDIPGRSFGTDRLSTDTQLVAMAHQETTGNRNFEFVVTNGSADGPYLVDQQPVTAAANVSVTGSSATETPVSPSGSSG